MLTRSRQLLALCVLSVACAPAVAPKSTPPKPAPKAPAAQPGPFDPWRPLTGQFTAVAVERVGELACALSNDGRVACWGEEVGRRPDRAHITGTASPHVWHGIDDVIAFGVGQGEVCVARRAGKVTCLGPQVVVDVGPSELELELVQIERAANGFCGRTAAGKVACFGWVHFVETGDDKEIVQIAGIDGARDLACDHDRCCAISRSSELDCFGEDHDRLGKLTGRRARRVMPGVRFEAIAMDGRQLCGIQPGGRVRCVDAERTPPLFAKRRGARWIGGSLEAGIGTSCVLTRSSDFVCDDGEQTTTLLSGVSHLSIDERSGCAVEGGRVWCWGYNEKGGSGDGSTVVRPLPERVASVHGATAIAVGAMSACALTTGGHPRCWGWAVDGNYAFSARATELSRRITRFASSQYFAYAGITPDGEVWQHSLGTTGLDGRSVSAVSIDRANNLCAANDRGAVSCVFSLGEDGRDDRWRAIVGAAGVVELAASSTGWCGRTRDGAVLCMRDDRFDEDDDFVDAPSQPLEARPVAGLQGVEQLAAGQSHYCARLAGGDVRCWGHFYFRGFSKEWRSKLPVSIPELRGASDIAANHFHTCAVVGQSVRCWGENDYGQLGDGTFAVRERPVSVALPSGVVPKAVAVGNRSSCLLDAAGSIYCWGDNSRGLLGDGRPLFVPNPVRVVQIRND